MTTHCKITLQPVADGTRYASYNDTAYKELFGRLRVASDLQFTRQEIAVEGVKYVRGMSISGVQQKLSLTIDENHQLSPVATGGTYLLKPSPLEFPHAAENEHTAMLIGKALGIATAQCGLVNFSDGEMAYITKRFDRLEDGLKLHQEDLAQGFCIPNLSKYEKSYEECGKLILKMTRGMMPAALDFFKRVIHAYVIGNDDFHLKNISLLKFRDNTSRYYDTMTPNYDALFTSLYPTADKMGFLALDLLQEEAEGEFSSAYQKYGFYTGTDFLELGRRLELGERAIDKYLKFTISMEHELFSLVDSGFMPDEMKTKAKNTVSSRLKSLAIGLNS